MLCGCCRTDSGCRASWQRVAQVGTAHSSCTVVTSLAALLHPIRRCLPPPPMDPHRHPLSAEPKIRPELTDARCALRLHSPYLITLAVAKEKAFTAIVPAIVQKPGTYSSVFQSRQRIPVTHVWIYCCSCITAHVCCATSHASS